MMARGCWQLMMIPPAFDNLICEQRFRDSCSYTRQESHKLWTQPGKDETTTKSNKLCVKSFRFIKADSGSKMLSHSTSGTACLIECQKLLLSNFNWLYYILEQKRVHLSWHTERNIEHKFSISIALHKLVQKCNFLVGLLTHYIQGHFWPQN